MQGRDPQARQASGRRASGSAAIGSTRFVTTRIERHVDYIHFNPVKHGHVTRVADWPHSSFHRHVERGSLAADWGGDMKDVEGPFGE